MKKRYFFYMVMMTMIVNVFAYVPNTLISQRFQGSIMAILLGVVLSTILIYTFSKAMMKFPGLGIPEVFKKTIPTWLNNPLLIFFSLMWYMGGALVLVSFANITKRFINPDMSLAMIILFFMIATSYAAVQSSKTQLYILEIVTFISIPFIVFIIFKALSSKELVWNEIGLLKYYIWKIPTFSSLAASTYTFIGYINMAIFNREIGQEFNTKYFWIIPIFGLSNLFTTFAIPIGFHGVDGIDDYPFPWATTADSLRMELAFMERVLYPFLLMYVNMCLIFATLAWHVSLEIMKSVLPKPKATSIWKYTIPWGIIVLFMLPPIALVQWGNMPAVQWVNKIWTNTRLVSEVFLVGLVFILAKRRGKAS